MVALEFKQLKDKFIQKRNWTTIKFGQGAVLGH